MNRKVKQVIYVFALVLVCFLLVKPSGVLARSFTVPMRDTDAEHSGVHALDMLEQKANRLYGQGLYQDALVYYERTYELSMKMLGENHVFTVKSIENLADIYAIMGRYTEALELNRRGMQLSLRYWGELHSYTIRFMRWVAGNERMLGRYDEAVQLDEKALRLSLRLFTENHPYTFQAMEGLAQSYALTGRTAEAIHLSEQAVAQSKKFWGENDYKTAWSIYHLGMLYYQAERYPEAVKLLEKALHQQIDSLGEEHETSMDVMGVLAKVYVKVGRNQEAFAILQKAYGLRVKIEGYDHPKTVDVMYDLAAYEYTQGHVLEAQRILAKAVEAIENLRELESGLEDGKQTYFAKYADIYKLLALIDAQTDQPDMAFKISELAKARSLLESSTARTADQSGILTRDEWEQLQAWENRIAFLNKAIKGVFDEPLGAGGLAASTNEETQPSLQVPYTQQAEKVVFLEMEKNKLVREYSSFRKQLMNKYPRYKQMNDVKLIDIKEGLGLIPDDAVFVDYLVRPNQEILALTISDGRLHTYSLGCVPNLETTIEAYRAVLQGKAVWKTADGAYTADKIQPHPGAVKVTEPDEISHYLGDVLLKPLDQELVNKRKWIISPDGMLALLPFDPLFFHNQCAIKDHEMTYVQSLSMYSLLLERQKQYNSLQRLDLLGIGAAEYADQSVQDQGPDEGQKRNMAGLLKELSNNRGSFAQRGINVFRNHGIKWSNLTASEQEIDDLQAIFKDSATIYKKRDASEEKLQELNRSGQLANYRYIVFSTHGFFWPDDPSLSSLVLSQVHVQPGTDGYITAVEWLSYNLQSDLVFLSACETGLGKFVQGESLMGLPYSFYVAGNKNVVFTLWQIADTSTAEFTTAFFAKVKQGKSQAQALAETKREFLLNPGFQHPMYWAPFILYGI